jgi:hypothetical protein
MTGSTAKVDLDDVAIIRPVFYRDVVELPKGS